MPVKTASDSHSQLEILTYQAHLLADSEEDLLSQNYPATGIYIGDIFTRFSQVGNAQRGATTGLLVLFVVAILVTIIIGSLFGYKVGYQRGYHSLASETKQAATSSAQTIEELETLRTTNKVLSNKAATAKQELAISLTTLDDLRQNQSALDLENQQVAQLNELYAKTISAQGGLPLQILGAKIEPLPENAFEYGFDIGMLSRDGKAKNLNATLTLLDDKSFIEVPLDPARYSIKGVVRIRGRFMMPEGFKPLQIKLNLEAGNSEVEQLYDWNLGDMVDNMPLSLLDLPEADQAPITDASPASTN